MKQENYRRVARLSLVVAALAAVSAPVVNTLLFAQDAAQPAAPATPATGPATGPATRPTTGPASFPPEHVILQVGTEKVTVADFEGYLANLPPRDQAMARGPFRRAYAESIMKMKLLAQEAEKRKLSDDPEVKKQLDFIREQVLAGALANKVQQNVDEAALKKYFEEKKGELERIAARHVLIRTSDSPVPPKPGTKEPANDAEKAALDAAAKAKATDIIKRLKAGEDFAKIAQAESDDSGSGAEGGDLGSFSRGRMVAPFEQAAFALKEGEITAEPVKSPFGYHVIQVTQKFDSYEELADMVKQSVGPSQLQKLIEDLRKSVNPTLDEAYLGPAMPEFGPPPPGGE